MTFDWYAELAVLQVCPTDGAAPHALASGLVDGCTVSSTKGDDEKREARKCYMSRVVQSTFALPPDLRLDPWPPALLHNTWLAIEVGFELLTPWYSKDDRIFHVLDNPVRKDRVFGVPFMAAASWKGMLRWACRMQAGLLEHLKKGKRFKDWNDPDWILHLFGNVRGEGEEFSSGALVFYPTWFDKIGFEVINPHDRSRRAGTQPIYYEVVPGKRPKKGHQGELEDGGKGALHLLYAPWPGIKPAVDPEDVLPHLLEAIETLLTRYGISAKRTVGWGKSEIRNEIKKWRAWRKQNGHHELMDANTWSELLKRLFPPPETGHD